MDTARALAALDELPSAVVVLLPIRDDAGEVVDFVFDYANRNADVVAGLAPGALLGAQLLASLPAFPAWLFEGLTATLAGGPPLRARLDYSDRFGGHTEIAGEFEVSASRLGDGLLVVYDDVAARERAHAAERRFGAVLDATSDWVSIADRDNNLLYINPAGRRMVGIGAEEDIAGRRIGEFSPAWARRRVLGEALAAARRDGVWRGDLARRHRDGHEIPISQVIIARTTDDGEVEFYATIARDMTRERAAEAALRESEERFRITFEQAPIGVSLLDLDGRFAQVNDAYCRIVRRSREELLALRATDITHPDDMALTRHAMELVGSGRDPRMRFEKRYVDPHGEAIWVELSASVFRDAEGRPQYLIGMVQDLGERRVAHTLQRSMLTTKLPDVDGVELAARYLPGTRETEVSGDWYDVIPLPDGRVGVAIGDVVGRGIEAAATMSQLRTALRAYAVEGLEPAVVVAKLHRLVDHLRIGVSTTLVYLDLDPFTRELRYVSAGHLPPLLVAAAGGSRFLAGARSTPLGTAQLGLDVPQERVVLAPGDAVLLYTDGLVERRDDAIDNRLEQLRTAVADAPDELADALEHLTATLADDRRLLRDDVALLALRVAEPPIEPLRAAIAPSAERLAALREQLRGWLAGTGATREEAGEILVAAGEACANAIEHAGGAADGIVELRARLLPDGVVVVQVSDRGAWRPVSPRPERGHGLRLMRILMDKVDIAVAGGGTRVELRRRLARAVAPPAAAADADADVTPLLLSRRSDVVLARLAGDVDLARAGKLGRALADCVEDGDRGLVVDLDGVEYLDSAGLHLLHDAARTLAARGQGLRVAVAPAATVRRLLELVGLERSVPIDACADAAVAALAVAPGDRG